MKSFVRSLLSLAALVVPIAHSGELLLNNGDLIEGEFVRIQGDQLSWRSSSFGELQVPVAQIDSIKSNIALKLDGHEEPCHWLSVEQGIARFECDDGDNGYVALMSLNLVIPHDSYVGGEYTYSGKLSLSGREASGNKEEQIWSANSETRFRRGDYRHESRIEYYSITQNQQPRESRGMGRYSLDSFFKEKWFWYNYLRFGFDEPADIEETYTYGTGLGYQVWEDNISALALETGVDFLKEHYTPPASPTPDFSAKNETAAWRWAADFRYLLPRNVFLVHRHQLSRSLEDSKDWQLETETGISMPLAGSLFSEIRFDYDVDNTPVEGNRREDKQIMVGVGYSW